jgi:circadian clock protein KaiC
MSDPEHASDLEIERFPSGVPGLDVILGGGFLRKSTYIIMGPPGTGKTILGNQICFHHVATGGRALYVTLLAESHARMVAHLRSLRFFDPAPVAGALKYISGYRQLEEHGLEGLLELTRKLIREHQATLLVVDGLVSAHAFAPSDLVFKKFIHGLNTLVPFLDCTTFLLTNGSPYTVEPEHTMVDGLVELRDQVIGLRAVRELSVRKFRGSDNLRGKHAFEITSEGITVFPRIEAIAAGVAAPPVHDGGSAGSADSAGSAPKPPDRPRLLCFGVAGLDAMLGGGVPAATTTMLLGPSGSGKTTLGTSFLAAGARAGESGLYWGFYEPPSRVVANCDKLGMDLSGHLQRDLVAIEWRPPAELMLDAIADHLLSAIRRRRVRRLFVDGVGALLTVAHHPRRVVRFFAALAHQLRALDVTSLFAHETRVLFGPGISARVAGLSALAENIVLVRQVEHRSQLKRAVSIIKTREHEHDTTIRELYIGAGGIAVGASFGEDTEAILTGIARSRRAARARPGAPSRPDADARPAPRRSGKRP